MMSSGISSWLVYVRLRRENKTRAITFELVSSIFLSIAFCIFWLSIEMPRSFAKDGLIDGLGSITSVLAGFYVAGLVAIATFFRENSSLDDVIINGPAILNLGTEDEERLTRRQYVCSIFGFLVALSFFLAISAVIMRSSAPTIALDFRGTYLIFRDTHISWSLIIEIFAVGVWMMLFIWQIILTLRGLYYLMDRIYDVKPVLSKPKIPRITKL